MTASTGSDYWIRIKRRGNDGEMTVFNAASNGDIGTQVAQSTYGINYDYSSGITDIGRANSNSEYFGQKTYCLDIVRD